MPYDNPDASPLDDDGDGRLVGEILAGLGQERKTLPPKLFYDAEGCRLFGMITELAEYYPTRTETALLVAHRDDIASYSAPGGTLVEYGASDERKAVTLLDTGRFGSYVPIDIAPSIALAALAARLATTHPAIAVVPLRADFTRPVALPNLPGEPFGFFPGSTIGNFEPAMVVGFLERVRAALGQRSRRPAQFLVGTDLRKSADALVAAYDDTLGVTARFNLNMLVHVNRVADADFDTDAFAHRAVWNDRDSRIEMHLVSRRAQRVRVGDARVSFATGETIHTESSYKYTPEKFVALAARARWRSKQFWTDENDQFGIHLLEAT